MFKYTRLSHQGLIFSVLAIMLAFSPPPAKSDGNEGMLQGLNFSSDAGWNSRYITNSRKQGFGRTGMWSGNLGADYDGYFGNVWWAYSDSNSDNEINFEMGKSFSAENFSASLYYVYLIYGGKETLRGSANDDHEMHAVLSCEDCLPFDVSPSLKMIYNIEERDYLLRLTISKSFAMGTVTFEPYAEAQYDHGYGSAKHDGMNSYVLGVSAKMPVSDGVGLKLYVKQLFRGEDLRQQTARNTNRNIAWIGASLTLTF